MFLHLLGSATSRPGHSQPRSVAFHPQSAPSRSVMLKTTSRAFALFSVAFLLALAPTEECLAQAPTASQDIEMIKAQSRRFSGAYVSGDINLLVSLYTSDGVAAPGGRDFIRGSDALLPYWSLPKGRTVIRHTSVPTEIEVDGDHAYDWGYYEGQAAQDGEPLDLFRGTYVIVWERGDDGAWRIAVDMWHSL